MVNKIGRTATPRRRFLQMSAAGVVTLSTIGGVAGSRSALAAKGPVRWISPRGTLDVMDDYAYWVAKEMGYFGDLATEMEPGPSDGTATVKFVDQKKADVGFPSPGVFTLGIGQGMDLVSAWSHTGQEVFDFAFRKGEGVKTIKELEGKTILLGSAAWQAITDPILAAAGVDLKTVKYLDAGWPTWGTALKQGQGDAALAWEGLRADWNAKGFAYDYLIGQDVSKFPANTFVIRGSDFNDQSTHDMYKQYFRGWAMGMEFTHQNPRAAADIVFKHLPEVKNTLGVELGTQSMLELANVFRGDMSKREGWGWHDPAAWKSYFEIVHKIGQVDRLLKVEDFVKNDFVGPANDFDKAKVAADANGWKLSADMEKVDIDKLKANLFFNVIR